MNVLQKNVFIMYNIPHVKGFKKLFYCIIKNAFISKLL